MAFVGRGDFCTDLVFRLIGYLPALVEIGVAFSVQEQMIIPSESNNLETAVDAVKGQLVRSLKRLPEDFHSSFVYTRTKKNYCHPITLSLIGEGVKRVPGVRHVGFDVRFNKGGGAKIQPDVVGFDRELNPVVYVDFESPNSSDTRILEKDIGAYGRFIAARGEPELSAPYIVVTSLPNFAPRNWEYRWMSPGYWNEEHSKNTELIGANPFRYWKRYWKSRIGSTPVNGIAFLNISASSVERYFLARKSEGRQRML